MDDDICESESASEAEEEAEPPPDLCCPLSLELFSDPVVAGDGETYEREYIERWIEAKQNEIEAAKRDMATRGRVSECRQILDAGIRSPLGNGALRDTNLVENRLLRRLARQWQEDPHARTKTKKVVRTTGLHI